MADWASRGRVVASCIATAAAAATVGAGATSTSQSSGVALLTYVDARHELCGMRADGSHRLRLLRSRPLGAPTWSADGRHVAFALGRSGAIFVADARGLVRWHITLGKRYTAYHALWAPDGRHIAYLFSSEASPYDVGVAVARPDGTDDHEIAPIAPGLLPPDELSEPAWTADGRLAFHDQGTSTKPGGIYSMNVDGSDRQLLVRDGGQPAFSPGGSKLAYAASIGGVYVADADGSNPRPLALSTKATTPTWSPNGKRIAFLQRRSIVVANADGSSERVIASVSAAPYGSVFVWSPDSKLIAFTRGPSNVVGNRPFASSIVVARADGGGQRVVLRRRSTTFVQEPAWRPATTLPPAKRPPCAGPS